MHFFLHSFTLSTKVTFPPDPLSFSQSQQLLLCKKPVLVHKGAYPKRRRAFHDVPKAYGMLGKREGVWGKCAVAFCGENMKIVGENMKSMKNDFLSTEESAMPPPAAGGKQRRLGRMLLLVSYRTPRLRLLEHRPQ